LAVGWIAVLAMPRLFVRLGIAGGLLIVTGGLVYSAGAAMDAWVVMTRCPPSSATTK
jgi:predicted membrane channel-forming protein YqfA (hemolysin III family)